jgi:tetratricopeptide (TPR) repeat protein
MRQALALYYRAGAYAQCERLLQRLLELEPDHAQHWHLLASVYLQQNKKRQALDQLALAWEKSVPFTERDILLLADLQAANKNPYGAAELLSAALAENKLAASGANYRKLFEFWFQAREQDKASKALQQAAQLSGDTDLYLYLAQLQMDQRAWQPMHETMLAACANQLADKYVGRANLLLGVSQLKLGDETGARRSFINATLIGGANAQAGQWLNFMQAAPTTRDEARRIAGICYGSGDKRLKVASSAVGSAETTTPEEAVDTAIEEAVRVKTVPAMSLFYAEHDIPLAELVGQLRSLALRLNISLVKAGGSAAGPLTIFSLGDPDSEATAASLQLALPAKGSPTARGRFRTRKADAFKCAYLTYSGDDMATVWADFYSKVQASGYELTGERRVVILPGNAAGTELQLGIK